MSRARLCGLLLALWPRAAPSSSVCAPAAPTLVIYHRLPWFEDGGAWPALVRNASAVLGFEYARIPADRDRYHPPHGLEGRDVGASHGDALGVAEAIRDVQRRSEPRARRAPALWERGVSFLEVPDVGAGNVARLGWVEDPLSRAVRGFRGKTAADLDACVRRSGAEACVPCESMTAWFCGGGAACDVRARGLAALVRARLVLGRDFAAVGVAERPAESLRVLERVLPTFFAGSSAAEAGRPPVFAPPPLLAALTPATADAIRAANALDAEFYDAARRRLDAQLMKCVGAPLLGRPGSAAAMLPVAPAEAPDDGYESLPRLEGAGAGACVRVDGKGSDPAAAAAAKRGWLSSLGKADAKADREAVHHCFPTALGVGATRAGSGPGREKGA